ncbi:MAG: hypothetical protein SRB1_02472 [Desulfobacteraceae bacterium Eth-SRB1]|nr:MAG: hypothetical protein SRB1_02472 [Desulfobacteraceae bacterium Eth-SRB1]
MFLKVQNGHPPVFDTDEVIFQSADNVWNLFRSQNKYILEDALRLAVLEPHFKSGNIYLKEKTDNFTQFILEYPLGEIFFINLLSRGYGVVLHACGVIDDNGHGYLFLGNSTHGKSTIAKLWSESGATVLNDDRIIVRERNGKFWMYGTPWHGDFNEVSSKALPIRKIFFLRHGEKNSTVPRKGAEAVSMLLTRAFPPLWDKEGMNYTLSLLDRMVIKLPCFELEFVPDKSALEFIRSSI